MLKSTLSALMIGLLACPVVAQEDGDRPEAIIRRLEQGIEEAAQEARRAQQAAERATIEAGERVEQIERQARQRVEQVEAEARERLQHAENEARQRAEEADRRRADRERPVAGRRPRDPRQGEPHPDHSPSPPLPERVELLRMAAGHLHEAGMHDLGEEVSRRAEALSHSMHPPHHGDDPGEVHDVIQDMRRQMEQMRDQLVALQGQLERLRHER